MPVCVKLWQACDESGAAASEAGKRLSDRLFQVTHEDRVEASPVMNFLESQCLCQLGGAPFAQELSYPRFAHRLQRPFSPSDLLRCETQKAPTTTLTLSYI